MIQFTQPAWLWGLAALAVPVAIHLLSRKEGRVVPVGSLRHLRETTSQQFRGIKLNELLLLALRLLLLILLVLLLAGLFWKNTERQAWVVVDRDLLQNTRAIALADSLVAKGYEWRWLESGFPKKNNSGALSSKNNWQAIEQLRTQHLQHAVVLSTGLLTEFKGELQPLGAHIDWQVFELEPRKLSIYGVEKENTKLVRTVFTSATRTYFESEAVSMLPDSLPTPRPIQISLVADKGYETEARIITAALKSIATLPIKINVTTELHPAADWLIWLSDKPTPETAAKIIYTTPASGMLLQPRSATQWQLPKAFTLDAALQNDLTIRLAALLTKDITRQAAIPDNRSLPAAFLNKTEVAMSSVVGAGNNAAILIFFLLVLSVERVVAFVRKQ
ncbi:MAG: BatA domain-containing protein [Cyclobacteriaceae bacterium]|nr:BatA domain-containing protein [Cyclobacteriaceae bacterium]